MQYGSSGNTGFCNFTTNGSYSFSNPVFAAFASYSSMSLLKVLGMSTYTLIQRIRTGNFSTTEDDLYKKILNRFASSNNNVQSKTDIVERARNNHLNDMENIIPFVLIGFFYIGTRPKFEYALWHFRIFFLSRLLHTIAYQVPLPQPTRTMAWLLGYSSIISMIIPILRSIQI